MREKKIFLKILKNIYLKIFENYMSQNYISWKIIWVEIIWNAIIWVEIIWNVTEPCYNMELIHVLVMKQNKDEDHAKAGYTVLYWDVPSKGCSLPIKHSLCEHKLKISLNSFIL